MASSRLLIVLCVLHCVTAAWEVRLGNMDVPIPACEPPNQYLAADKGDSLRSIADRRNLASCVLHALNPSVWDPSDKLVSGQAICVPGRLLLDCQA